MKVRQLAICDSDSGYLRMLQAYLQRRNPADFEILIFDAVHKALEASRRAPFEILLVGEGIYDTDVAKISAAKRFVLQEDGLKEIAGCSVIAKYQSMERLIAQVLGEYALDESCRSVERRGKNRTRLVSFYSPDRHRGQSVAALGAAQVLAEDGDQVLYLSMMPFAGFEELLQTEYDADVTDFMYFVLNHSEKLLCKLDSIKRSIRGVDYLPPALDYEDLVAIDRKDWETVADLLLYSSDYTYIVMDLSETCKGFYDLLESSDQVYLLTDSDSVCGRAMLSHFRHLLRAKEWDGILARTVEFELPPNWERQCGMLENLAASPVGICMKGVLGRR